jgi:fluoroacetyl-CoA thioesterase
MKASLNEGFTAEATHTVTEDMSPPHMDALVLSTPSMVHLIETTCLTAIIPHLDEGETSVGTHVNISHKGPASAGEEVVVKAVLSKIDRRRLTFTTTVHSPRGLISDGTHERAVVDTSRFS